MLILQHYCGCPYKDNHHQNVAGSIKAHNFKLAILISLILSYVSWAMCTELYVISWGHFKICKFDIHVLVWLSGCNHNQKLDGRQLTNQRESVVKAMNEWKPFLQSDHATVPLPSLSWQQWCHLHQIQSTSLWLRVCTHHYIPHNPLKVCYIQVSNWYIYSRLSFDGTSASTSSLHP